jgi:tryptophan synthase alpha chain
MVVNAIDQTLIRIRANQGTALIPFITIGDPNLDTSIEILKQLQLAGADIVELGVPYSDPLADGPIIQRASQRALLHEVSIIDCIRTAKRAREAGVTIPFVLFGYFNPVLQLGLETFFKMLNEHDISGIIIPDLPVEEASEVGMLATQHNIHLIPLVAPTSKDRVAKIVASASGFVYCVSSLGVTGMRADFHSNIDQFLDEVREATSLPIAVGFGISKREQAQQLAPKCDAIVVGSAIVNKIESVLPLLEGDASQKNDGLLQIQQFVRELKV